MTDLTAILPPCPMLLICAHRPDAKPKVVRATRQKPPLTDDYAVWCDDCDNGTAFFATEEEAVAAWHRRPESPPLAIATTSKVEAVAKLVDPFANWSGTYDDDDAYIYARRQARDKAAKIVAVLAALDSGEPA